MKTLQKNINSFSVPRIMGLSHIGLFVKNIEESLIFYHDFLGLEEQFQLVNDNGELALKFMKLNDRQFIELFPERAKEDERLYQVAFIVENVEKMRQYLSESGIEVPEKCNKGRIGNLSFSAKDPDGHILEFVQYTPEGWTSQDNGKHLSENRISARLKHIGFTVGSLEKSLTFYRDILGCTETWRGSSDGKNLSWVNMKLPESDEYLELMLYNEEPTRERKGIMNHMSLEVNDVPKSVEILKERANDGFYKHSLEHKIGKNKKRLTNLFDPDGTRTELMEPNPFDGMSPEWFQPPGK